MRTVINYEPERGVAAVAVAASRMSGAAEIRLRIKLFGRVDAQTSDGISVLPRQRKTRAMLAVLALAAPRAVLRTDIAKLLWSRRESEQARASLRQSVHELQSGLSTIGNEILVADRTHLALRDAGVWVDAVEFARATATRPGALDLADAGTLLQDLVGLDEALDRWIDVERERLHRGALQVAQTVLSTRLAEDAPPQEIRLAAERLVSIEPTNETGWRAVMSVNASLGERAAAIEAFERCSAALAQRKQLAPSNETLKLLSMIREDWPAAATPTRPRGIAASTKHGVRLGVLPLRVLDSSGSDGFALGLAEEITAAMAKFRWISLIASPSLAAVQAMSPDEREQGLRALGLDFLLDGTIQRVPGRVRATMRLLDMASAAAMPEVVWANRFDGNDFDLLTLQDRIAAETVAQVDPQLLLREGARADRRSPQDVTAYDLLLRAIPAVYRLDEVGFRSAGIRLAEAVSRDPQYAAAHAWWAYWYVFLVGQGWAPDEPAAMARAGELAERAVQLDPSDARALAIAGHVRAYLQHRIDDALALHERALAANPNLPLAWVLSGMAYSYDGQHDEAVRRIDEAVRLSPFDPHQFFFFSCATIPHLMRRDFVKVVDLARRASALNPTLSAPYKAHLSALGHLGATTDSQVVLRKLLLLEPRFCVRDALQRAPLRVPEDREVYASGLRLAGVSEEPLPSGSSGGPSRIGPFGGGAPSL